ncbi:MAG: ABC transporter substrate-binding protein [Bdellovibrionaceae bacterium]|nr:ABC transporter substrate-binding protein [Pseudobdellovibrionaceae bacterium]
MIKKISVLCLGLLLALGCTSTKKDKTFVYCSEGSPSIFNPQLATDGPTFNASSRQIYNRLVEFEAGGTKVLPSLAKSWEVSKDGLEFTFHLEKNVNYHTTKYFTPTRTFNADDVLFSFNRQRLKDHDFYMVNGGNYQYFQAMEMGKIIKDIKKVDDYTVQFLLTRREAPFLANLAMDFASVLSKEYADNLTKIKTKEKMDLEPVGTGPFVFKRYVKDSTIRYVSHKKYFKGEAKIKKLVFSINTDPSVRYQKLKTGECHLMTEPSPIDIENMKSAKNVRLMKRAGLNVGYLAMNVDKKPFDNALVRQAMNHALNKSSYIKAIYLGNASVAKNPIPPSMWSYNNKVNDYDYDLEKAKNLLVKAGYKDGFKTQLWTLPVSRPYNPNGKKMGELIQADLAKIGVKVELVTYDWPTYLEKSRRGEHQMIQLGWTGDNGDPDNFLNVLLGCSGVTAGSNVSRWCNKSFASLIMKAKTMTDIKQRTSFYEQAQVIFKKEAPWVTLAHASVFKAMAENVVGYKISPFGTDSFYEVDLK